MRAVVGLRESQRDTSAKCGGRDDSMPRKCCGFITWGRDVDALFAKLALVGNIDFHRSTRRRRLEVAEVREGEAWNSSNIHPVYIWLRDAVVMSM